MLEPDPHRHWLRKLWQRKRARMTVDAYALYVQRSHPHMLPKDLRDLSEYMHCVLRGLY
jgi:hypothetical protein